MLVVAGGKGGCGKTTTTACLARSLATAGTAPVAVDADLDMPDLHVLGETPAEPGLARLPTDGLARSLHRSGSLPGVRILPAGRAGTKDLIAATDSLRRIDGPVLLDAPAGASPDAVVPMRVADSALLVTTPERESLEDAAKTAAMARTLGTEVAGTVVVGSDGDVDPQPLLACPTLGHVPWSRCPIPDTRVSRAYDRVTDCLTD